MSMKRTRRVYIILAGCALIGLSGCNLLQRDAKEGAVVQVGNNYLYAEDLAAVTQRATTPEDSARYAEAFIRRWATDILQYQEGKSHSTPEIEALVEDYRRSLYVAEYERYVVDKRMPKTVLKKRLTDLTDEENLEYIEKYAYQYASGYELFTEQWRTGNQILMRMPTNNWQKTLAAGKQYAEQDSTSLYLLQVTDCRLAGEPMPVDYAREAIDKIILSQRRVAFLQQQRKQLYDEAVKFGKVKFDIE